MGYRELQLSVALNVYRYYTHPFNCKVTFFLVDWSSLAIRNWQLDLSTHSPRPQTRKPHAFISPLPLLLLLFLTGRHHQATELAFCCSTSFFSRFRHSHDCYDTPCSCRCWSCAALEDLFLARTFPMLPHSSRFSFAPIFLSSRQALLCCTAPPSLPRCLSVAHCFSSTTATSTVHASLSPSINRRSIIDHH